MHLGGAPVTWVLMRCYQGIAHGFGQHIDQLPEPESTVLFYSRLLNWNLDLFYAFSLGSSKLSLLALYWRLFSITNIRQPIRLLAVCAVIWIIVRVGYIFYFNHINIVELTTDPNRHF